MLNNVAGLGSTEVVTVLSAGDAPAAALCAIDRDPATTPAASSIAASNITLNLEDA
jgi:hypothetical protein